LSSDLGKDSVLVSVNNPGLLEIMGFVHLNDKYWIWPLVWVAQRLRFIKTAHPFTSPSGLGAPEVREAREMLGTLTSAQRLPRDAQVGMPDLIHAIQRRVKVR
jgi:hypothetical protein